MRPIDFSIATFADLRAQLVHLRASVYEAWQAHGPGTTREVAKAAGSDLLVFRPRTTELVQLGFVVLIGHGKNGHEGIYRALTTAEAERSFLLWQSEAQDLQTTFEEKL